MGRHIRLLLSAVTLSTAFFVLGCPAPAPEAADLVVIHGRGKDRQPPEGWYPEQRMTPEEAVRAYTSWSAYAAHWEDLTGVLAPGRWADLTLLDIDPLVVGETDPGALLDGNIVATIVAGEIVFRAAEARP